MEGKYPLFVNFTGSSYPDGGCLNMERMSLQWKRAVEVVARAAPGGALTQFSVRGEFWMSRYCILELGVEAWSALAAGKWSIMHLVHV